MKTTKLLTIAGLMAATMCLFASCGKKENKTNEEYLTTETLSETMEVDSLLANAELLTNKEITVEGVCTHICAHGAKKLFLMGSDDTKVIRVQAGEFGAFDTKCPNNIVRVKGILKEERIDEGYLIQWEEQIKNDTEEKHGEGEGGCSSEKHARGETAQTTEERISDFRSKIADRKAKEGKEYLSFYFVEATSYEIR